MQTLDQTSNNSSAKPKPKRRYPVGAEVFPGGVHFRVWAPQANSVEVSTGETFAALAAEEDGYFSGWVEGLKTGALYRLRLNRGDVFPDPVSRFQPEGPHGPSQVVDPAEFNWTDKKWQGRQLEGQVVSEIHIGTFTQEGTYRSATAKLPEIAEVGITVLELMPLAEFPGRFGWGYDGVDLFAPYHGYGTPDELRQFIDTAHDLGMSVILDVVYNHLGPDGNYLAQFSRDYFSKENETDWGEAINFDGQNSGPVREFFLANAAYWIEEFHFDGLRLDATQNIYDKSSDHILAGIVRKVREAAGSRKTIIVAENEPQETCLVRDAGQGGFGIDGLWNDDYHHSAIVRLTSHNDSYYTDYLGKAQEFLSAMKYGYLYQGQWYKWQKQRRGTPALDLPCWRFISYIQNHDQIANSATGQRCNQLTSPGRLRAITAMMLLAPGTPMLFQGQEFGATTPFHYFADHKSELAEKTRLGRIEFMEQWQSLRSVAMQRTFADPSSEDTFKRCKLDWTERGRNQRDLLLHKDLLRIRRDDHAVQCRFDGAVLNDDALIVRFFGGANGDRLLVVNFGRDLELRPAPEPLLAPPDSMRWGVLFSSEDPQNGGTGTAPLEEDGGWRIPGEAAVLMGPQALHVLKRES